MTEDIWLRFKDNLMLFVLSKVHDRDIAEDIVQEVFIRIHSKIATLRDETKILPWIYQIARNLVNDFFRRENKIQTSGMLDFKQDDGDIADEQSMMLALKDMIEMMDKLPPEYCEALCQTELGNLSQKEFAEKIGISYSGAKSRVQRARQMLKDMLLKCCHYEFDRYGTVFNITPKHCCHCC